VLLCGLFNDVICCRSYLVLTGLNTENWGAGIAANLEVNIVKVVWKSKPGLFMFVGRPNCDNSNTNKNFMLFSP
jgi:hypothetical protein